MKKLNTKSLVTLALLVALEIILSRFLSINAWNIRIGFAFIPVVICAVLFGPVLAGAMAGVADVIGAILFPTGAFFPGFTLTAVLMAVSFALCLHKKRSLIRIIIAVAINQLIFGLLLNTLFISILYGSPFIAVFSTRIIQCALLLPVQVVTIKLMDKIGIFNRLEREVKVNEQP